MPAKCGTREQHAHAPTPKRFVRSLNEATDATTEGVAVAQNMETLLMLTLLHELKKCACEDQVDLSVRKRCVVSSTRKMSSNIDINRFFASVRVYPKHITIRWNRVA